MWGDQLAGAALMQAGAEGSLVLALGRSERLYGVFRAPRLSDAGAEEEEKGTESIPQLLPRISGGSNII